MRRRPATLGRPEMWAIRVCPNSIRCRTASVPPRWLSLARTSTCGRSRSRPRPPTATVGILLATSMMACEIGIEPASTSPSTPRSRNDQLKVSSSIRSIRPSPSRMCLPPACSSGVRPSSMSATQGWRMSFSSTPTVRDRRSARNRAAALGRYPSSATARMTASRLAGLTFGELWSTSDTSDFDTPARAATVSRVGRPPFRPVDATAPLLGQLLERSNAMGTSGACQRRVGNAGMGTQGWGGAGAETSDGLVRAPGPLGGLVRAPGPLGGLVRAPGPLGEHVLGVLSGFRHAADRPRSGVAEPVGHPDHWPRLAIAVGDRDDGAARGDRRGVKDVARVPYLCPGQLGPLQVAFERVAVVVASDPLPDDRDPGPEFGLKGRVWIRVGHAEAGTQLAPDVPAIGGDEDGATGGGPGLTAGGPDRVVIDAVVGVVVGGEHRVEHADVDVLAGACAVA